MGDRRPNLLEILDAARLASNQFPDKFWKIGIKGAELRVLKYVWSNVIRLYQTFKKPPIGEDGTPRFWKPKESMADDCEVSFPTFRNAIRTLNKLGLVTSMESAYGVGLSVEFFDEITFKPELERGTPEYQEHLISDILPHLYDKFTVDAVAKEIRTKIELENDVAAYESIANPPPTEFLFWHKEFDENGKEVWVQIWGFRKCPKGWKVVELSDGWTICINPKIPKKPITVKRTSIFPPRKPSLVVLQKTKSERMMEKIEKVRKEMHILTPHEKEVMEVAHYYEYKCRTCTGSTGWRCVGKKFWEHRNWMYLNRIYDLCKAEGWDYKVYMDAQFDRASYWKHEGGRKYPYLNQFFSDKAKNYYFKYVQDYQEKFSPTGDAKVKTSVPQSYIQDIADSIVKDCRNYLDYLKFQGKRKSQRGFTDEEIKLIYVLDKVMTLSPYYWASLEWSVPYLKSFDNPMVDEVVEKVIQYQKSKAMMRVIRQVVTEVETYFGIVSTRNPMKKKVSE